MNFAKKVDFGSPAKRKKREREIRAGSARGCQIWAGTLSLSLSLFLSGKCQKYVKTCQAMSNLCQIMANIAKNYQIAKYCKVRPGNAKKCQNRLANSKCAHWQESPSLAWSMWIDWGWRQDPVPLSTGKVDGTKNYGYRNHGYLNGAKKWQNIGPLFRHEWGQISMKKRIKTSFKKSKARSIFDEGSQPSRKAMNTSYLGQTKKYWLFFLKEI